MEFLVNVMPLEEILKKLGWEDGFQIPIANDENKELEEQLAKLSLRKNKGKHELDRAKTRLEGLKEHFKYVVQENDQNQKLITAQNQLLETTKHYYHLARSEEANVQSDMKKMGKQLEELTNMQLMKKSDLQRYMAKAETLKAETEWDAEALKAWEETLKKRDEDIELIEKFSREDASKFNQLESKRQLLQLESDKKKKALAKIIIEHKNNEMIIDRTGKVFKQQETERDALIGQWKEGVKMLQQRDDDVVNVQQRIATTQELMERQREKLEEENGFLENEKRNNHELDLELESLNALNSRMRRDTNDITQELLTMRNELHALKHEVSSSLQILENERLREREMTKTITQKENCCMKFDEDITNLKLKLEEMKDSSTTSAEKVKNLEKMAESQDKLFAIYVADTEKINSQLYRSDTSYKEQVKIGKSLEMELANTTLFCSQLRKRIKIERNELEKLKEVVYSMEYRIDEFEKKLITLELEPVQNEFLEETEKKIEEQEEILANHKAVQHTLQTQVDRLREEMDRLKLAIAWDKEQQVFLTEKCEQHMFENEVSKKHIAAAKRSTQEKQVEENMMRLRINHIENDMKKEDKMIFNMEKLRLNLDQLLRERQVEINTKKMILQAKRRNLDEDRGRLKIDISLSHLKINQFQKKYHVALSMLGKDEEGQPASIASFRIKYAQEKIMLQQEGDTLDQKIKTAEKEIVAMENTLKLVNLTNAAFKKSVSPIGEEDKEVEEMKMLEQEIIKVNNILKEQKKLLMQKKEELEVLQKEVEEKEEIKDQKKESATQLDQEFDTLRKQENDKANKLERAECQIKRLLKKIGKRDISQYNRDFEIKLLKDGNRKVLDRLMQLCSLYPEIAPLIHRYMDEYALKFPEKKFSWSSSSSSMHVSLRSCSTTNVVFEQSSCSGSGGNLSRVDVKLNI